MPSLAILAFVAALLISCGGPPATGQRATPDPSSVPTTELPTTEPEPTADSPTFTPTIIPTLVGIACIESRCVYLPSVQYDPLPTATPTMTVPTGDPRETLLPSTATPTGTQFPGFPTPQAPCDQYAPTPVNGVQAWMTVPHPARFSNTTVCARLIENGQAVVGAPMSAIAHYKTTDTNLGSTTTGTEGVGRRTFNIGGATAGFTVVVDVTIGGRSVSTSFTP